MNNNIRKAIVRILFWLVCFGCEQPGEFTRDSPYDPKGTTQGGLVSVARLNSNSLLGVGVAAGPDGTVFLTHRPPVGNNSPSGLSAFRFDGASLTQTAFTSSVFPSNARLESRSVYLGKSVVNSDGTIFTADGFRLSASIYDGTSITVTAQTGRAVGLALGEDETIFAASRSEGLRAWTYNDSTFTETAAINDGGFAYGVAPGPDGTLFLANGDDGLRAYTYDGSSFTNTAHISTGGKAFDVAVDADGTIFVADRYDGLDAYTYDGSAFTPLDHVETGNVNPARIKSCAIAVDAAGFLYQARLEDGLYVYAFDDQSFSLKAYVKSRGNASDIALGRRGQHLSCKWGGWTSRVSEHGKAEGLRE